MTSTTPKAGESLHRKPPRENLVRAFRPGIGLRSAIDGAMPTMHGHFAVFNRWTEIDSWFEGNFLERIAPGAFKKTFREKTPKVLFQHGQDPQIADKPLGPIESLSEDETGAAYEVSLLDTAYNRELIPGLEAGLYGASFRFKVMREEIVDAPKASDANPRGLPERTIREAQVMEFGPVTFPAYDDATAGIRSLTDRFLFDAIERDPSRARDLLAAGQEELLRMAGEHEDPAERSEDDLGRTLPDSDAATGGTSEDAATGSTSDEERREPVLTWQQVLSEQEEEEWIPRI